MQENKRWIAFCGNACWNALQNLIGSIAKGDKTKENLPLAFVFLRYYAKGIKVVLVLIA